MLKILCFGTFDGVHDGHRAMLRQAKRLTADSLRLTAGHAESAYLIVAVAPDATVKELKGGLPHHKAARRIQMLKDERLADEVLLGDPTINDWSVIKRSKANVIALGYDQVELKAALETFLDRKYPDIETPEGQWQPNPKRPTIVVLSAHEPNKYHNRILHS